MGLINSGLVQNVLTHLNKAQKNHTLPQITYLHARINFNIFKRIKQNQALKIIQFTMSAFYLKVAGKYNP